MEFIPFVSSKANGFDNDLYAVAIEVWRSQLATVLDTSDDDFLTIIRENTSLHAFVTTVLDSQLNGMDIDSEVLKRVFLVFVRAGRLHATGPLISIDLLSSFAVTFGETNPEIVQLVFSQLLSANPALSNTIQTSVSELVGYLETIRPPVVEDSMDRLFVLVRLLDALTWAAAHLVVPQQQQKLLNALFGYYSSLDSVDADLQRYQIKRALVATWDHVFEYAYFQPIEDQADNSAIDRLSDQILKWIEKSDIETSKRAFTDAPIIMDWQVETNVSQRLDEINMKVYYGDDERLEFLKLSMEQVRDMTIKTTTWGIKVKQRRTTPGATAAATSKTKAESPPNSDQLSFEDVSRISQIHDLFPDLGAGFIKACLLEYNNDVETVVMQLLEDTLPPNLANLDRSLAELPLPSTTSKDVPESTETSILASRRNIFDNDEFDLLSGTAKWDRNKMHMGKMDHGTAETLLSDKTFIQEEKENVLQRIYDMYEDEYDDTYDGINESSGPVGLQVVDDEDDAAADIVKGKKKPAIADDPGLLHESDLVHAFVEQRDLFSRTSAARKSPARAAMRQKTGMSDEQIEGWGIMFSRNPRKQRILDKYMLVDDSQEKADPKVLKGGQTKQRQEQRTPNQSDSKQRTPNQGDSKQRTANQGDPKQRTPNQDDAKQRANKDKNKARIANHSRKRGHDKKMQKAGVTPTE